MAYLTASEIKRGLTRLGIPMVALPCPNEQLAMLISNDRQRVTVSGLDGVLISYHLENADPDDCREVIVALSYPQLHNPASVEVQQLVSALLEEKAI